MLYFTMSQASADERTWQHMTVTHCTLGDSQITVDLWCCMYPSAQCHASFSGGRV